MKRTLLTVLVAVGLSLGLAGTCPAQKADELREEYHRTFPLAAGGRISLENISGAVKITAWDRNEIKIDAVKRAYSRERLTEAQISINSNADNIEISTEYPEQNYRFNSGSERHDSMASVDYTLTVPRGARLEAIELVNGNLEIVGVTGDVKASLVNGHVAARGLSGEARLSTVNGRLDATFERLSEMKMISLGSVNGPLTLTIPSDSNAQLRASTVHGPITNDFGLPVRRNETVGRNLAGALGTGGPRIKLGNVNGPITIRRAADNRPLSPATNQLPETARGDEDEDEDEDEERDQEGRAARREGRRAAREAAREAARAQIDAQRASRATELEATRAAQADAVREANETRREAERIAREARLEAQRAVLAAQAENAEEIREAQRAAQIEARRAIRESQREIQRASRDAARAAREATRGIEDNNDLRLVERESKSFTVSGLPRITLNTFDGRISIRSWNKAEVMMTAIKRASNEQALRGITVTAEQQGSSISILTNYDKSAAQRADGLPSINASVTLELSVPRNANIQALSGDGRVELDGVTGGLRLQTGDGRIDVRNSGGQLIAKTGDGGIDVLNYTGDVDANTGDGRISLDGRFSQLMARTGDGPILLTLPTDLDATIETDAESVSGGDVALEAEPNTGKKLRRFRIGRGGTVFRLQTGEGIIYLRRR